MFINSKSVDEELSALLVKTELRSGPGAAGPWLSLGFASFARCLVAGCLHGTNITLVMDSVVLPDFLAAFPMAALWMDSAVLPVFLAAFLMAALRMDSAVLPVFLAAFLQLCELPGGRMLSWGK